MLSVDSDTYRNLSNLSVSQIKLIFKSVETGALMRNLTRLLKSYTVKLETTKNWLRFLLNLSSIKQHSRLQRRPTSLVSGKRCASCVSEQRSLELPTCVL
jgi:hypothetical protein